MNTSNNLFKNKNDIKWDKILVNQIVGYMHENVDEIENTLIVKKAILDNTGLYRCRSRDRLVFLKLNITSKILKH